jgi:hypothetical protein
MDLEEQIKCSASSARYLIRNLFCGRRITGDLSLKIVAPQNTTIRARPPLSFVMPLKYRGRPEGRPPAS